MGIVCIDAQYIDSQENLIYLNSILMSVELTKKNKKKEECNNGNNKKAWSVDGLKVTLKSCKFVMENLIGVFIFFTIWNFFFKVLFLIWFVLVQKTTAQR